MVMRQAPRFTLPLDVKCRPVTDLSSQAFLGNVRNISVRGLYFLSAADQPIGARLNFIVTQQTGQGRFLLKGTCTVVRCDDLSASHQEAGFGIAAKIEEVTP